MPTDFTQFDSCLNTLISKAACAVRDTDFDLLCDNPDFLEGVEAAIAKKMFEYANDNEDDFADGQLDDMVNYYSFKCSEDQCCDTAVIKNMETGLSSCCACDDEETSISSYMKGKRWETDNADIVITGQDKKRYFEELIGVEESDILSVTIGDAVLSFGTEIVSWDKDYGIMTFLGKPPVNMGGRTQWITIQWNATTTS